MLLKEGNRTYIQLQSNTENSPQRMAVVPLRYMIKYKHKG